ncbi:hypothetical protein [Aureitalea marina]|uniref:Four helix bundle protein n=1 Tax=Aureitalea marina TaxID=930804 RepID=A0A2S7KMG3_9FLAO|nr:hypothetical protein [Aureitalea marina]PQB03817.1 hypothetical protein BST85_02060 [Aureitalea marina]
MIPNMPPHHSQSAVYQKALEIFSLSRSISHYLVEDLNQLSRDGKEDPQIYFSGDIVQQSISLAPEILKAESQVFAQDKRRYAASVNRLTNLLYRNCERLEKVDSNGKDFLPILRTELKKFRLLVRSWMLTM